VHLGLYAIPTIITAISEIFINVTAYGIAYTQSPKNMKGLVASINLFMSAVASIISLSTAAAIVDPYLPWVFAAPTVAGAIITVAFWFTFKHLDNQEFIINTDFDDLKLDTDKSDIDSENGVPAPETKTLPPADEKIAKADD
jgi:dipeptide/tripeptide permease